MYVGNRVLPSPSNCFATRSFNSWDVVRAGSSPKSIRAAVLVTTKYLVDTTYNTINTCYYLVTVAPLAASGNATVTGC